MNVMCLYLIAFAMSLMASGCLKSATAPSANNAPPTDTPVDSQNDGETTGGAGESTGSNTTAGSTTTTTTGGMTGVTTGSEAPCDTGLREREISVFGINRTYLVYLPSCVLQKTALPIVFMFHGFGSNAATQVDFTGLTHLAESAGFFLVFPQALGEPPSWSLAKTSNSDLDFVDALAALLEKDFKINTKKRYAIGHSNGAQFSIRLAELRPLMFAAVSAVAVNAFDGVPWTPGSGSVDLPSAQRAVPLSFIIGQYNESLQNADRTEVVGSVGPTFRADRVMKSVYQDEVLGPDPMTVTYGCTQKTTTTPMGSTVSYDLHSGCREGSEILWYYVPLMYHTDWASPKSARNPLSLPPDSNTIMWDFFKRFQLP